MKIVNLLHLAFGRRTKPLTTIVLHGTAGSSARSSASWLDKIGLSYHAICSDPNDVDGDGAILKCVRDSHVAYHAGVSKGPNGAAVNAYSLGFAWSNPEDKKTPISVAQWRAGVEWCASQCRAYPSIRYITTHAIVSPGRKFDPRGPVAGIPGSKPFPLQRFCEEVSAKCGRQVLPWS
jgi:N-acetyl-anhydromuramyl-L-alanine amidase AmpD